MADLEPVAAVAVEKRTFFRDRLVSDTQATVLCAIADAADAAYAAGNVDLCADIPALVRATRLPMDDVQDAVAKLCGSNTVVQRRGKLVPATYLAE